MRRFLRIHLGTGIVLMLLASAALGLNLTWRPTEKPEFTILKRGWPWHFDAKIESKIIPEETTSLLELVGVKAGDSMESISKKIAVYNAAMAKHIAAQNVVHAIKSRHQEQLTKNVAASLLAMLAAAVAVEWRIRKKRV